MTLRGHVVSYRPPRIAMALAAIGALAHWLGPIIVHGPAPVVAGLLAAGGFLLMLRAWWLFRDAGTAICPTAPTSALITDDVFGWTRHPMYLGITLMLSAAGLATGDAWLYIPAALFWMIIDRHFVPYEEAKLCRVWGDSYRRYRARVRRWI